MSEPHKQALNRTGAVCLACTVVVYVLARLWHLTSYGLFGDEVFTFWAADQSFGELIASVLGDVVHPPLFYIALNIWISVGGSSIVWLKLLPVLISLASVPLLVLLGRELQMRASAINLSVGLIAVNSFLVGYAQELRMYSLLMTLTLASLWLFAKLVNGRPQATSAQIWLASANLLLVFTHYFGWLIVALELLFLLVWKRERARVFAIGAATVMLAFAPWAYAAARAAGDRPGRVDFIWNAPPGVSDLVGFYANLNGALSYRWKILGTLLISILFAAPMIAWGGSVLRLRTRRVANDKTATFWWFAVFAFAAPAIVFLASHFLPQSVWAPRYLIIAAPVYLMFVAASIFELRSRLLKVVGAVLVFAWAALSGVIDLRNRDRIAVEPIVARMLSSEPTGSAGLTVYSTDPNLGNTIQYYLDHLSDRRCEVSYVERLDQVTDEHFWAASIRYRHETGPLPQQILSESGYRLGEILEAQAPNHKAYVISVWKIDLASRPR